MWKGIATRLGLRVGPSGERRNADVELDAVNTLSAAAEPDPTDSAISVSEKHSESADGPSELLPRQDADPGVHGYASSGNDFSRKPSLMGATELASFSSPLMHTGAADAGPAPKSTRISVRNVRIADVVSCSFTSTRLSNAITRAVHSGELPVETIGEYLRHQPEIEKEFLGLSGFGRKCMTELTHLVRKWDIAAQDASVADELFDRLSLNRDQQELILNQIEPDSRAEQATEEARNDRYWKKLFQALALVPFPECVLVYPISVRLRNALEAFENRYGDACESLGIFLGGEEDWQRCLEELPNVGRKTVHELDTWINRVLESFFKRAGLEENDSTALLSLFKGDRTVNLDDVVSKEVWQCLEAVIEPAQGFIDATELASAVANPKAFAQDPEQALEEFLSEYLAPREWDVLMRRFGIKRKGRQTLDEIAQGYDITRERVRQIERKALQRCSAPANLAVFQAVLTSQHEQIGAAFMGSGSIVSPQSISDWRKVLTGFQVLSITAVHGEIERWFDAHFDVLTHEGTFLGWLPIGLSDFERAAITKKILEQSSFGGSLRQRVRAVFHASDWPISVRHLLDQLPDVAEMQLLECLRDELGAEVRGGVIRSIQELPSSTRLILVLRDAKRALHLSEIRARHNRMFGFDIEENAAGGTLGRLEEALIVERGTYDIYENLCFDATAVRQIRDATVAELKEAQQFLSAKILQRRLIDRLPLENIAQLSPYMLLGICQDDPRFSWRRGLMIGLANETFERSFSSLNETIHGVVREHGPVSVADIQKIIAYQRDVLEVGISTVLQNSAEIVAVERGKYDVIDRVIGDDRQVKQLRDGVQIALLDGPKSLPIVMSRLGAIGVDHDAATIASYLRGSGFVEFPEGLIELKSADPHIREYDEHFRRLFDAEAEPTTNKEAVAKAVGPTPLAELVDLDFRLILDTSAWQHSKASVDEKAGVLAELMSDFEF